MPRATSLRTPRHLAHSPRIPGVIFALWVRGEGAVGWGRPRPSAVIKLPFVSAPFSRPLVSECGGGEDFNDMVISCLSTGSFAPARAAVGQWVAVASCYNKYQEPSLFLQESPQKEELHLGGSTLANPKPSGAQGAPDTTPGHGFCVPQPVIPPRLLNFCWRADLLPLTGCIVRHHQGSPSSPWPWARSFT